ncbi:MULTISPECIES: DUF305 domain-containing protein [unclassified Rathayibacter]|uniref:DUF305 domain-containing protein n=1 Tax=unclassified Rathayibacter TaxID=2609250 RepID=UPI000CE85767|nr:MULTISPECIES: DUF305 domain-containing protein [unclassified Rathayibacter]PPF39347.1 DUF305 domain-containing protein [Rathayibacter sp. AY1A2]PPG60472.1 DUF305 domain-containing protein [Rathayibacter sp. AY1C7]PPH39712.1 DUF305 domain-containing protein [Rathayibacter sp. AY1E3]PPH84359.1 DUF305 domain-containing protein [Rathayibacter sp. AY1D5]PPI08486.1 DUF305 domain-containing protein [Rathayibacter sp. AY1B8]
MNNKRTLLASTLALATAITLAACSDSSGTGGMEGMDHSSSSSSASASPSSTAAAEADFNDQDVMFAQMMKPHHEQAVEMADMILAKDGISTDVTDLATQIKEAQGPEIAQLEEWISAWGAEDSMSGMDHSMDGMMSDEDMSSLESATGAEAETLFLEQMMMHHEGAVEMAQTEVDEGQNADAIDMANTIVQTQTEEIATMQDLLASR